jgi:hypothetical protein
MTEFKQANEETEMDSTKKSATREDVEELKYKWQCDPEWDLAETEGFEAFRDELTTFRLTCEAEWEQRRLREQVLCLEKLASDAATLEISVQAMKVIYGLTSRLGDLEREVEQLQGKGVH